jgi:hypothetical protein
MPDMCAHYMPEKYTVTDRVFMNKNPTLVITNQHENHDAGTAGSALFCRFPSQEFNIV